MVGVRGGELVGRHRNDNERCWDTRATHELCHGGGDVERQQDPFARRWCIGERQVEGRVERVDYLWNGIPPVATPHAMSRAVRLERREDGDWVNACGAECVAVAE